MSQEKADFGHVDSAIQLLSEHFDSVQIFCTRHEMGTDDGTVSIAKGVGNWFARRGQVSEWLTVRDEETRIATRTIED